MKKLMIATAVAAAGFSALFADVYNLKFTAKTPVDVANSKGEVTTSLKSVTVQGLWDVDTGVYKFWKVNSGVYTPIKNATLALVTQGKFLKKSVENKAQVAEEYELLWGAEGWGSDVEKLEGAFVASGLTKQKVDSSTAAVTLTSMSGSFAGQMDGKPAYGTWSLSKNSTATKKGLDSALPSKLTDREFGASEDFDKMSDVQSELAEINGLFADATKELDEVNKNIADLTEELTGTKAELESTQSAYNTATNTLAGTQAELEGVQGEFDAATNELASAKSELEKLATDLAVTKTNLDSIVEAVKGLNDNQLATSISSYLEEQLDSLEASKKFSEDRINEITTNFVDVAANEEFNKLYSEYCASNEVWLAASNAYDVARNALAEQRALTNLLTEVALVVKGEFSPYFDSLTNATKGIAYFSNLVAQAESDGVVNLGTLSNAVKAAYDVWTNAVAETEFWEEELEFDYNWKDETEQFIEDFLAEDLRVSYDQWLSYTGYGDSADQRLAYNAWRDGVLATEDRTTRVEYINLTNELADAEFWIVSDTASLEAAKDAEADALEAYELAQGNLDSAEENGGVLNLEQLALNKAKIAELEAKIAEFKATSTSPDALKNAEAAIPALEEALAKAKEAYDLAYEGYVYACGLVADYTSGKYDAVSGPFGSPIVDKDGYAAKRQAEIDKQLGYIALWEENIANLQTVIDTINGIVEDAE